MLIAHGATHTGKVRKTNEDAFLAEPERGLFLVADGMGGHNAGEVASQLALEAIRGFLARSADGHDFTWPYGINPSLSFHGNRLITAVKLANRRVFKAGESRDEYAGLGTTVVVALIDDGQLSFSGVGDSRIYVLSQGRLEQLTQDDSWAAAVLGREAGTDRAAIAAHPMRHVLTNAIGARGEIDVEVSERALKSGDTLLLCSDGLHGALDEHVIASHLASDASPETVAGALVDLALERDGKDNITALVVRWKQDEAR
jgi:serine/threonine protein phosphatase PrpC